MASFKLYLDTRTEKKDGTFPLKIMINHRKSFLINLKVAIKRENFINNEIILPQEPMRAKNLNRYVKTRLVFIENTLNKLMLTSKLKDLTDKQLKAELEGNATESLNFTSIKDVFDSFIKQKIILLTSTNIP